MNYSFYLFSKLFDAFYEIECPYDYLFGEVLRMYEDYEGSKYNDPNKGEYECMVKYLEEHQPMISEEGL